MPETKLPASTRSRLDHTSRLIQVLRSGRSIDVFRHRVGKTHCDEALTRLAVLFSEAIEKPIDDWSAELRYVVDETY